jgi:hypothetical protein
VKRLTLICLLPSLCFADLDPKGMTQVMNGVDDSAYHVQLGHEFPYLDKVFTDAWMSTNGFILLWSPTNQNNLGVQTRPTYGHCCDGYNFGAGTPNYLDAKVGQFSYMLAPLWTDLDDTNARDGDGYYYSTNETESKFLWYKVTEYNRPNSVNTFQLNIDKTGGYEYLYQDVAIDSHQAFIGWTGDTAADPFWHTQQFYGDKFTMNPNATGQLISGYGGDLTTNNYGDVFGLVGQASTLNQPQGGGQESAPPTFSQQATDTVFGDSADDFMYLDQPDSSGMPRVLSQLAPPQIYQEAPQEQMFGGPPTGEPVRQDEQQQQDQQQQQQQQNPEITGEPAQVEEVREARPVEVVPEVVQVTREPRPEPAPAQVVIRAEPAEVTEPAAQREPAPVEVVAEARAEPVAEKVSAVVKPAVDVVGISLSLTGQSYQPQSFGVQQGMAMPEQTIDQTVVEMQEQITQVAVAQSDQQEVNGLTQQDLAPPTQMQFENDFNDAIATGQSVGQFLSAQLPDFSQFDVAPPSQAEQRTVQRAETQIQTMSQADVQQSLDSQLENLEDTGGFTDQSLAVFLISNNPAFSQYDNVNLSDRQQFYSSAQPYPANNIRANPLGLLRVTGNSGYDDLVELQWQR